MAYTTIDDPEAYFQSIAYTGNETARDMTLPGTTDMQPDFVWTKGRSFSDDNNAYDSLNGVNKYWAINRGWSIGTNSAPNLGVTAFNSDGFSLGVWSALNRDGETHIAWCWKGGTTSGINATGADITPSSYTFSQDAGISIIRYTGNGSSGAKIAHGLGAKPAFIVCMNTATNENRMTFHHRNTSAPETDYLLFNTTAVTTDAARWNDSLPGTVYFEVDDNDAANKSGDIITALCFAEKQGFSKFGTYTGNVDADGPFLYTGFRPAFFCFKETGNAENWIIYDNKRTDQADKSNPIDNYLSNSATTAEASGVAVDFVSNGIKLRANNGHINEGTYVFLAFAESPFVNSSGVPCNAM